MSDAIDAAKDVEVPEAIVADAQALKDAAKETAKEVAKEALDALAKESGDSAEAEEKEEAEEAEHENGTVKENGESNGSAKAEVEAEEGDNKRKNGAVELEEPDVVVEGISPEKKLKLADEKTESESTEETEKVVEANGQPAEAEVSS